MATLSTPTLGARPVCHLKAMQYSADATRSANLYSLPLQPERDRKDNLLKCCPLYHVLNQACNRVVVNRAHNRVLMDRAHNSDLMNRAHSRFRPDEQSP